MPDDRPTARRGLTSVAMAARLLKAFSDGDRELGVTQLARKLGLAKSSVHRLATTLTAERMLEHNRETGRYRLGLALFSLGALVRQRMDVPTEARPHLFALREATNETVHLGLLDGTDVITVYDLESTQAIRMRSNLGSRRPALVSAEGRAMLAFADAATVDAALALPLLPRTPRTVTEPRALRAALEEARRIGYCLEDEQSEPGMRSVAAPLRGVEGHVVAAIGVAGPRGRLDEQALPRVLPLLLDAARAISARLGYQAGQHAG